MLDTTGPSKPSGQHRVSRSNSLSTSFVATVQHASSLTAPRQPTIGLRPQSPNEAKAGGGAKLRKGSLSPENPRPTAGGHSRPGSIGGIKEGVGNLNRWSQSTTSSRSSISHKRRNSFSRRLSFGGSGSISSLAGFAVSQSPQSRNALTKQHPSPGNSPRRQPPNPPAVHHPATVLPPLATFPSLTIITSDGDSPSSAASGTPATAELLTTPTDYFGNKWAGPSPPTRRSSTKRTVTARSPLGVPSSSRTPTASPGVDAGAASTPSEPAWRQGSAIPAAGPVDEVYSSQTSHSRHRENAGKGSGSTEAESSASSMRSNREGRRRHKPPSQKAMLSKALQKAHTAVLLDNAQNFEGAMDAYRDACALLRQVMQRSSGEEDKKKLEAIVSSILTIIGRDSLKEILAQYVYEPDQGVNEYRPILPKSWGQGITQAT